MVTQEREVGNRGEYGYYKTVRLISLPDEFEGLVFVSPAMQKENTCDLCKRTYGPLVYQAGHTVRAQHFQKIIYPGQPELTKLLDSRCGGIYFLEGYFNEFARRVGPESGIWVATLEPRGPIYKTGASSEGYTEEVLVKKIRPFCRLHELPKELKEGVVYRTSPYIDLHPICDLGEYPPRFREGNNPMAEYSFRTTEFGTVSFSKIRNKLSP